MAVWLVSLLEKMLVELSAEYLVLTMVETRVSSMGCMKVDKLEISKVALLVVSMELMMERLKEFHWAEH